MFVYAYDEVFLTLILTFFVYYNANTDAAETERMIPIPMNKDRNFFIFIPHIPLGF